MSTGPNMSIGGIVSGLPPDLIDQIIKAEREPINRLTQRQADLESDREAWGTVTQKLSGIRSSLDDVRRAGSFDGLFEATSSSDAVDVSVTGSPRSGSATFEVLQLAQAEQQASSESFAGLEAELGDREFSLNGVDLRSDLGEGATLGDLVDAINDAGLGVNARTLQVSPGEHRLVLEADETGASSAFDVSADGWEGGAEAFTVTRGAQDAELDFGGISVTRPSNTIDDLEDGLTLDLRQAGTGPVTVTSGRDVDAAVEQVSTLVERINGAISTLQDLTAYDPESGEAGPLQGDTTARAIINDLRQSVAGLANPDGGEGFRLASDIGIELTRRGGLTLDESALREAFEADFDAAASLLTQGGSSSDETVARVTGASRATAPGEYEVEVTTAAEVARLTGAVELPPPSNPQRLLISAGGTSTTVTISNEASKAQAIAQINDALAQAGMDAVTVHENDDGIVEFVESRYGSGRTIEVAEATTGDLANADPDDPADWNELGSATGVDAVAEIAGQTVTGRGQSVTVPEGDAEGLRFRAAGAAGETATLTARDGIGGTLDKALARMEGAGGSVRRASDAMQSRIDQMQSRIETYERRIESREQTLMRQFAAMETAMARLMDQQQRLQGQLGGMM